MDVRSVGQIQYDYLQHVSATVRNGVARTQALDRYQDAAYSYNVKKNALVQWPVAGSRIEVAA